MKPLIAPLFVPATRPDRFPKAALSGADAVIVDWEDAVPPASKAEARRCLDAASTLAVPALVRINGEGTEWHEGDLAALREHEARQVCVPKVETAALLDRIAAVLGSDIAILALIETALGLENAGAIAAHPAVRQLAFGPADFFLDMDMAASPAMTGHALARLATASRAAGKARPLDGPCFAAGDVEALAGECRGALQSGAGGKLCIHPSQPAKVIECFAPSADEVAWAERIAEADRDGAAQLVDGRMIDAPVAARARRILQQAAFTPGLAQADQG